MAVNNPTEKFNLLMDLTNTSNANFARSFNFDASYISRIRCGKRKFPEDPGFLFETGRFFAVQISNKKIENTASSAVAGGRSWPADVTEAGYLIRDWLLSASGGVSDISESRLGSDNASAGNAVFSSVSADLGSSPSSRDEKTFTYYGNEGQRKAILDAFEILCRDVRPYRLLVYSDESLGWFSEDSEFFGKWFDYCCRLIEAGSTITVINYLDRNLSEMKDGFRMWIPLILTGRVMAYHCENEQLKHALFEKTLCIAEDILAVKYDTIRSNDSNAITTLYFEKNAVDALTYEFKQYLSICKPLYYAYSCSDAPELTGKVNDFNSSDSDMVYIGSSPLLITSDKKLSGFSEKVSPLSGPGSLIADYTEEAVHLLERGCSVSTVLLLPKKDVLLSGGVYVPLKSLFGNEDMFFSPEEYILLLEKMMELANRYPKYRILVGPAKMFPADLFLMFRPGASAFLCVSRPDERIFHIIEDRIISSMQRLLTVYITMGNIRLINMSLIKKYISDVKREIKKE